MYRFDSRSGKAVERRPTSKKAETLQAAVIEAVAVAETAASSAFFADDVGTDVLRSVNEALHSASDLDGSVAAATAVREAILAAASADDSAMLGTYAALEATNAGFGVGKEPARAAVTNAVLEDFQRLVQYVDSNKATDETPVPPSVFGPMWPDGLPPGWPQIVELRGAASGKAEVTGDLTVRRGSDGLSVSVVLPEFHDQDAVAAGLVELYSALNDLHVALGGSGLKLRDSDILVEEPQPSEVPQ